MELEMVCREELQRKWQVESGSMMLAEAREDRT